MGRTMPKSRKCRPTRYAVVSSKTNNITYGFRCAFCNVPSMRFASVELREERLREHKKVAKKNRRAIAKSSKG